MGRSRELAARVGLRAPRGLSGCLNGLSRDFASEPRRPAASVEEVPGDAARSPVEASAAHRYGARTISRPLEFKWFYEVRGAAVYYRRVHSVRRMTAVWAQAEISVQLPQGIRTPLTW